MCIIMVKPKGVKLPEKSVFKQCFENNSDGCGFMYVDKGKVIINKGYMGYKNMYKNIKRLIEQQGDRNIVVHFRIGTSGKNDQRTTHPYPVTSDTSLLQKLTLETDLGIVHNGVISGYKDMTRPDLNDTQVFIRDHISILKDLNDEFYKNDRVLDMLEDMTNSKLCFLNKDDELYYVGMFTTDNGVLYSNTTYKHSRVYYGNYNYKYDYGKYDYGKYDYDYNNIKYDEWKYEEKENTDLTVLYYGMYVEYAGKILTVTENDNYAVDADKTLYEIDIDGNIIDIIAENVSVYDSNYEEVIIA